MLFKDVYGQKRLKEVLAQSVNNNRLPHALLLYGPQGTGKLALALALAQYVNCKHRTETDACGVCPSCQQMQKLVHPDVHFAFPISRLKESVTCQDYLPEWRKRVLELPYFNLPQWEQCISQDNKQSVIYANESDEIIKSLSKKSYESEYKVMIIWLPEKMMNDVCANKLLKIIEEPPQKTLFILVSDEAEKLLPTITSRTQRFFVPPLSETEICAVIQSGLFDHEGKGHEGKDLDEIRLATPDEEETRNLAHIANGSLIAARDLYTEFCYGKSKEDNYHARFAEVMRYCYQRKVKELKKWSEDMSTAGRKQQLNFLRFAQRTIRENFIYNLHEKQLNYQSKEESDFSTKFSPFINEKNIAAFLSEFETAERQIEQNVQAKIVFFDIALKIAVFIRMR